MKIAILSDAHDNMANTKLAVEQVQQMGAEVLFFCGDFCAPGPAKLLCEFKGPIYGVFGNNDGDPLHIYLRMKETHDNVTLFMEGDAVFEIAGRKIALTHYPLYGEALARTGDYDFVCFGHDHNPRILKFDNTVAVNPGCLNMVKPNTRESFAIYDSEAHSAILYDLNGKELSV